MKSKAFSSLKYLYPNFKTTIYIYFSTLISTKISANSLYFSTGNHVAMMVTAIFDDDNLLATGVLMEAKSIEDDKLQFNVFVYNVQDSVKIDYATGESEGK